jgi:hypothetical protein
MEQSPPWETNGHSASQSQSYFATDCQSVSQSVLALSHSETHDQILAVVKTVSVLFVGGRPPWRVDGSVI